MMRQGEGYSKMVLYEMKLKTSVLVAELGL